MAQQSEYIRQIKALLPASLPEQDREMISEIIEEMQDRLNEQEDQIDNLNDAMRRIKEITEE